MDHKATRFSVLAILVVLAFAGMVRAEWVNGWWVYPYTNYRNSLVNFRPYAVNQKGLDVRDYCISNVPVNTKGMLIGATGVTPSYSWAYRWVSVTHCEIKGVWRSGPGVHNDFLRIYGQWNQDVPTTVLLQDLYIHDGDSLPIIVQDGKFDRVTFKDIRIQVTGQVGMQVATLNCGYFGTVLVDHCPNTWLHLVGRPGTIGTIYIKNSPGLRVMDVWNQYGRSNAKIIYLD